VSDPGNPSDPNAVPPGYGPPPPGYGPPPPGWGPPPAQYGYGTPYGYGGYAAPTTDGKAIGALVSAIASFVICPFVPAVVALVLAGQAMRSIRESGGRLTGESLVTAARIIAWIHLALCLLGVGLILLFMAAPSYS
jgi:hypothetical protein